MNVTLDDESFRAFVAARSPALLSFAYLLTGDRRDAEDVVQTALARTALAWWRVRRKDNPEAYVRKAIVNTHLNLMRRQPWRERPTGLVPEQADGSGPAAEGAADERDAMWRLLATLPPRQRAVLVLRYYEDLPVAAVAEILGCSQGTVKSQSVKALAHLRAALAAEEAQS